MSKAIHPRICYQRHKRVRRVGLAKPTKQIFRKKLALAMHLAGLNQIQVGKGVGVRSVTISRYLSGENEPNFEMIDKLAKFFEKESVWFLEDKSAFENIPEPTIPDIIASLLAVITELKRIKKI